MADENQMSARARMIQGFRNTSGRHGDWMAKRNALLQRITKNRDAAQAGARPAAPAQDFMKQAQDMIASGNAPPMVQGPNGLQVAPGVDMTAIGNKARQIQEQRAAQMTPQVAPQPAPVAAPAPSPQPPAPIAQLAAPVAPPAPAPAPAPVQAVQTQPAVAQAAPALPQQAAPQAQMAQAQQSANAAAQQGANRGAQLASAIQQAQQPQTPPPAPQAATPAPAKPAAPTVVVNTATPAQPQAAAPAPQPPAPVAQPAPAPPAAPKPEIQTTGMVDNQNSKNAAGMASLRMPGKAVTR